jgi:hypothetical protein
MVAVRGRSDAGILEDGGKSRTPTEGPIQGALAIERRARSDALPENGGFENGGHPHAPTKAGGTGAVLDQARLRRARSDALPENTAYADTGCEVHSSCLSCPLVRCRYDQPGGTRRIVSEGRDRSIVALRRAGEGVEEIASRFGVSRRTVFRALARTRRTEDRGHRTRSARRDGGRAMPAG